MKLKKFLMFIVVVIVTVTLGMTVWYFVRDDEVIIINERPLYMNVGDIITLEDLDYSVTHPNETTEINFNATSDITSEFIDFTNSDNVLESFYTAKKGGSITLEITTTNSRYPKFSITVEIGDGSENYPFIINNATDLSSIGSLQSRPLSANYRLSTDIVLTSEFTPIGYKDGIYNKFTGTLDGNGNSITGLSITNNYEYAGLFCQLGENSEIKNLTIANANLNGEFNSCGIVAGISNGWINTLTITNCNIVNNRVQGNSGLLAGYGTSTALFSRNAVSGSINANGYLGGLVGTFDGSRMRACWANAELTNTGSYTGGLIGYILNSENSWVAECYSLSTINASTVAGGLIGYYPISSSVELYGLYFNSDLCNKNAIGEGTSTNSCSINAVSATDMKTKATYRLYLNINTAKYASWDFSNLWYMESSGMYPIIRNGDSRVDNVVIETPSTPDPTTDDNILDDDVVISDDTTNAMTWLETVRTYPDKIYILTADLDFGNQVITPIDNFSGAIYSSEGNTFTIKNYRINAGATTSALFKRLTRNTEGSAKDYSGVIKNVNFSDITVTSTSTTSIIASVVGTAEMGTYLYNIELSNININASANNMGGFVGSLFFGAYCSGITINNSNIQNSNTLFSNTAGLFAINNGIIGFVDKATDEIALTSLNETKVKGVGVVGGLVASNNGNINNIEINNNLDNEIELKTNTNNYECSIGAIAGISKGQIENAKITASLIASRLSGNTQSLYVGGAVGNNCGTIISVLSISGKINAVATDLCIGGIAGINTGNINSCFNSIEINGGYADEKTKVGGIVGKNKGYVYRCINLANVTGTYAGGIAGENYSTDIISSISFSKLRLLKTGVIKECYSSGVNPNAFDSYISTSNRNTITGVVVGGIVGIMNYGYISDCAVLSNMQGNTEQTLLGNLKVYVAGLVGLLNGSDSRYGLVENCISSCTFGNGGTRKFDTVSPVYEKAFLPELLPETGLRTTGTILNCIVDRSLNFGIEVSYVFSATESGDNKSGSILYRLSTTQATSNHTVYHQVLDPGIWKIMAGSYPLLRIYSSEECPEILANYLNELNNVGDDLEEPLEDIG